MKVVTLAAGMAVGYVLGTRAGREKYELIVANARKVSAHPSVVQAQNKAKELLNAGTDAVAAKVAPSTAADDPYTPATTGTAVPRPARRKSTAPVAGAPLA
jgi:uncharacterized protein (UPF0333 family)